MYPSGETCLTADCYFNELILWGKKKSNVAYFYHIAAQIAHFGVKQQSLTHPTNI